MSKKKNQKQQPKPNVASPAELLPPSPSSIFETLSYDCISHVLSFLPLYNVCSLLLTVCWQWNEIICKYFGIGFIRKWNDPKNTRLGGGMLILRPVCAAVSLLWSMEQCEILVELEDKIKLLCVRYETAMSMHLDKLVEHDAKEIIRLQPQIATGHLYLGDFYAHKGSHDKARKEYNLAMQVDPGNLLVLRKMNDLGMQVRVNNLAEWMTRMSTIKRLVIVAVILIFVVLFVTQALRVF